MIHVVAKKWVNGTVLHYYFFDRTSDGAYVGTASMMDAVRRAFQIWKEIPIGWSGVP
jgi:hypothetical protein